MGADSVGFDTIRDSDFQVRTLDLKLTQLEIQKIKTYLPEELMGGGGGSLRRRRTRFPQRQHAWIRHIGRRDRWRPGP